MRSKDAKHHGHNPAAHHGALSASDHAVPPLIDTDGLTSPWPGDFADDWESAWIDLGGEG
jgi:hypothetical protein